MYIPLTCFLCISEQNIRCMNENLENNCQTDSRTTWSNNSVIKWNYSDRTTSEYVLFCHTLQPMTQICRAVCASTYRGDKLNHVNFVAEVKIFDRSGWRKRAHHRHTRSWHSWQKSLSMMQKRGLSVLYLFVSQNASRPVLLSDTGHKSSPVDVNRSFVRTTRSRKKKHSPHHTSIS